MAVGSPGVAYQTLPKWVSLLNFARAIAALVGLYYAGWLLFGVPLVSLVGLAFIAPLIGAIVAWWRPLFGGVVQLFVAAGWAISQWYSMQNVPAWVEPDPTRDLMAAVNGIMLVVLPALVGGGLLVFAALRARRTTSA